MDWPGYKNLAFFVFSLFFFEILKKLNQYFEIFTILIQYFSTPTFTHEFILVILFSILIAFAPYLNGRGQGVNSLHSKKKDYMCL